MSEVVRRLMLVSSCFGREVCTLSPCACAETLAKAIRAEALEQAAQYVEKLFSPFSLESIANGIRTLEDAPLTKRQV
jgi:hypothetical protein